MSYAGARVINDADSHLMELPDFLTRHADPGDRAVMPPLGALTNKVFDPGDHTGQPGHTPETVARLTALGDQITRGPKWHDALGSFNGGERTVALDLMGFKRQVIFASFCARLIFEADPAIKYQTARAHNRGVAEFCAGDKRLIGVAIVPMDDPDRAVAEVELAHALGLGAIWIAADAAGGRSPGHPANDRFWRTLEERRLPFILHVGSAPLNVEDPWINDGIPDRVSARGGAEVIGSKDLTVIHHTAHRFISVMVLDGTLERFRNLKGGIIEIGAGWVPDMIRRLDHGASIWAKSEPHLTTFARTPGEQIRDQLRFTPYPFEDVAQIVSESAPELYMFSSDYPHAEGGRDPIGRFDAATMALSDAERSMFFERNFETLYGMA